MICLKKRALILLGVAFFYAAPEVVMADTPKNIASDQLPITIVPEKSLGDVSLGATEADLLARGFTREEPESTSDRAYFQRPPFRAALRNHGVGEITVTNIDALKERLVYDGKFLPDNLSDDSLSSFFQGCQRADATGASYLFCNKADILLSHSYPGRDTDWSIAVLSKDEYQALWKEFSPDIVPPASPY